MKRILLGMLVVLVLALTACGGGGTPAVSSQSQPDESAEELPEEARERLLAQAGTPNIVIESAAMARTPDAVRDTGELWCVVTAVERENAEPIRGQYIVFVTGDARWNVSISDTDEFFEAGCANYRELE